MVSDPILKTVVKSLQVMTALNKHQSLTIGELHRNTGITRQALYRILKTLCEEGFANQSSEGGSFRQTEKVHTLSDNFRQRDKIAEIVVPIMEQLSREVGWPVDLAVKDQDLLILSYTTRNMSPIQIDRVRVGFQLPFLYTGLGRAYLAFCPKNECQMILEILKNSTHHLDIGAGDSQFVRKLLRETKKRGYGLRMGEIPGFEKSGTIAVPLKVGHRVVATLGVTFIRSAMEKSEIPDQLVEKLRFATEICNDKILDLGAGSAY